VDNCSACHTEEGAGLPGLFPPLKGSPVVMAADPSSPIRFVLEGGKSAATGHAPTGTAMPAFGWKLSDDQVAAVITYVRSNWGNEAPGVSPTDVRSIRQKDCTGLEARLHLQPYFDGFCKK
jgi:mono/diheme cytochrome c family protein